MSNVNADVVARVQQLEQQGAGKSSGWDKVIGSNNPTHTRSLESTEVAQAKELLNNIYVDRNGVEHAIDNDGNPVDTNTAVAPNNSSEERTEASYVGMKEITNKELTQANAAKAYESGNHKDMTHAIHEELVQQFAPAMDQYKSTPAKVWVDVQKFAKASKTNNQRKVFNEVMQSGTGTERQQAINSLIQDFKQSL